MEQLGEKLDGLLDKHFSFARKSAFREYAESIGIAVIIALILRALVIEAFKIPSGSMIPTLKVGDHIFVNKFIYGIKIPFTDKKLFARLPQRGDVIVFLYPKDVDKGFFDQKDFIKRVVAVAGDKISVYDGVIRINGQRVEHRRLGGECSYVDPGDYGDDLEPKKCIAYAERIGDNRFRVVQSLYRRAPDFSETTIPENHVFVMGDNRDNSSDSREWGLVHQDLIKGKAMIIWWSRGAPTGVRWTRFFGRVHAMPKGESVRP
ncbi:MAG: signal peptidase I [Deltaproteobacteria bacterium]|nr:signal peptidase I [Deltaproteobacteria bacterium]